MPVTVVVGRVPGAVILIDVIRDVIVQKFQLFKIGFFSGTAACGNAVYDFHGSFSAFYDILRGFLLRSAVMALQ